MSITTNGVLFLADYSINSEIYELLTMLKQKYKIFLITAVDSENGDGHKKAKAYLDGLVKEKIVKDHRVMYCSTQKGKEALIR